MTSLFRIVFRSIVDFFRDGGPMLAGSLSFFTMMAMVPFSLFLVTILGRFLGANQEMFQFFVSRLMSFFPKITSEVTDELRKLITYHGLGKFSLVLYGLLSYQLFASLETAINVIFKIPAKRPFLVSLLFSLVMVTLVIAALFLSFGATSIVPMIKTLKEFFPSLAFGRITGFLLRFVIPLFLIFLILVTLYLLLPRRRVRVAHALSGALLTAVFLEGAKHLFAIYVVKVAKLGTIYGPLSAFVIFLLWMFYSACIFLIGAEVVHNLGTMKRRSK